MSAIGVLAGMLMANGLALGIPTWTWLGAPLAAFLITGAGNIANDIRDRQLDATAHPSRPLPSGAIEVPQAAMFAIFLMFFGLWEARLAGGWPLAAFAAANAAVLGAYEWWLKARGLLGNITVALLVGSTFVFGAFAVQGTLLQAPAVNALAAMAALATLGREILKDVEDLDHDRRFRSTLAMQVGANRAQAAAVGAYFLAVGLSIVYVVNSPSVPAAAWAALAAANLVFIAASWQAFRNVGTAQRWSKLAMLLALAAFIIPPLLAAL